jgi:5-methylcytosine-specific restriction endonuclease McrA
MHGQNLKSVPDDELLRRLCALLKDSRRIEADLIAHIAEVDARRLYAREAAPSMFAYCTERMHLSEPEAALRIRVARTARRHPEVLTMLRDGKIHLSGVALLGPLLTPKNRDGILRRATYKSKRDIERLVAELAPRPDVAATMRRLPVRQDREAGGSTRPTSEAEGQSTLEPATQQRPDTVEGASLHLTMSSDGEQRPDAALSTPARRAAVEPLSRGSYKVSFTASAELHDKLERLQALTHSSVPDGDLGRVIELAVTRELERLEARRFGKTKTPRKSLADTDTRPKTRHIPAAARREVHRRDGGRCTYRDALGRRCTGRYDLEFHHRSPFGRGGEHSVRVLTLMCPTHNALMAEHDYGNEVMARFRRRVRPGVDASRHG